MARIVRFADLIVQPWKNGGGATRTICSFPEGAGLDDFDARLSIADVASDGPFSRFDGVDRTLALLDGPDMTLTIDGESTRLGADLRMISFAGEADVVAALTGGPTRDFNVMTRRSRLRRRVESLASGRIDIGADETLALVAHAEGARIGWQGGGAFLARFDAALLTEADGQVWVDGSVLAVRLIPVKPQNAL